MSVQKEQEQIAIMLEVSGEHGDLNQYKKSLCEASILGIRQVLFSCIWDHNTKLGEHFLKELKIVCKGLEILPLSLVPGYSGMLFDGEAAIVTLDQTKGSFPSFSSAVLLDEYKKSNGIEVEEKEIQKVFAKLK